MYSRDALAQSSSGDVLRFWRDVETFNIPAAPKKERKKTKAGKLTLQVAPYKAGEMLPWQPGHSRTLVSTETEGWVHAVFLGVTETKAWAEIVLRAVGAGQSLPEDDLQRLSGQGWLAAFVVNSQGQIAGDSFVPASFSLGVQRLRAGNTLDGLNLEIKTLIEDFKGRWSNTLAPDQQVATTAPGDTADQAVASASPQVIQTDWNIINDELQRALKPLGDLIQSKSFCVVVKSRLCARRKGDDDQVEETNIEFLNSFYLDDLDRLIVETDQQRSLGGALNQYLGAASSLQERRDILLNAQAMTGCLSPAKLTLGRWPAKSNRHLMLAQQAAVGEITSQLQFKSGLVAVNGPPGTGKTTLLCDVVADVVVNRAKALAELSGSWAAFGKKTSVAGLNVFPFKPEIVAGTGIVVTSNNNTAVENITRELPALSEIAKDEYPGAAYFQEVAAQIFAAAKIKPPAWGLVAAALGNSDNRRTFANAFFRDGTSDTFKPGQPCDIKTILEAQEDNEKEWDKAKADFLHLLAQVETLRNDYSSVEEAVQQLQLLCIRVAQAQRTLEESQAHLSNTSALWTNSIADAKAALILAQMHLVEAKRAEQLARLCAQDATDRLKIAEAELTPRIWDHWLKAVGVLTGRMRAWEAATRERLMTRASTSENWHRTLTQSNDCERAAERCTKTLTEIDVRQQVEIASRRKAISAAEQRLQVEIQTCQQYEQLIVTFKGKAGTVPDDDFFARPMADRHLASAWVDPEFDTLRARLFLAALRLHEVTLYANKGKAIANLRAVSAMLLRSTPEPIAKEQRSLIWDMLFFTVPVVSSTLASFDRLFAGLERESLGWLLIDEAGQATPQSVAGAIWRSKRAVVIGDPLQVEPVMTVPSAVVAELRNRHRVDTCWSPSMASAQTVSDRTMALGAYIGDAKSAETAVWTGLPLRAHHRCIDPMFSVANTIAYEGQMVQANKHPDAIDCILGESAWLDVRGSSNDGQVVAEEMACLTDILLQLKENWPAHGEAKPSKLFVISPFRKVAEACWGAFDDAGISKKNQPVDCGTVHRFQGKASEIVVIVLGSAPGKDGNGSRTWASIKPNLLNVALTRAKLRVYVIGNAVDWGQCPQFDVLIKEFRKRGRVLDASKVSPEPTAIPL